MSAPPPKADFKLVLMSVNPAHAQNIAAELADVFPIDRKVALSAVQAAPIVLVGGMTQQMAVNLRSHLVRLGRLGAQLRLTADPVGKLRQLRWPSPPPATRRPANMFMCPSCGERFVVHRWQPAVQAPLQPAAVPAPTAAPAAPPALSPTPEETPLPEAEAIQLTAAEEEIIPEAEPVEAELPESEPVSEAEGMPQALPETEAARVSKDELAEITGFLDSILGEKEKAPEAAPAPAPVAPSTPLAPAPKPEPPRAAPPPAPQAIPITPAAEEPKTQPLPAPQPVPMRLAPAPAPPSQAVAPKPTQTAAQARPPHLAPAAPAPPKPMAIKPQAPAPAKPPVAAPPGGAQPRPFVPPKPAAPPEPAGPRYDVSVARVRGAQQDELARLLVQRMAMAPEDAQKQVERTVIMVCKGGSAAEAEEWRKALEAVGIKPRIRKH